MTSESYSASTSSAGSANAAELRVEYANPSVGIRYDVSGAATITVEVTNDGTNWHQLTTYNPGSAGTGVNVETVPYAGVRAYADTNLNELEVTARGDN